MNITLIAVGRPGRMLDAAIADYEARARRYWSLDVIEVREERSGRGVADEAVRNAEGARIMKRMPKEAELVALTRTGAELSSGELARQLELETVRSVPGVAYVIGGAFGLSDDVLGRARRQLRLSSFTMPHDLARLVLLEQLYRAGTIIRGEPYHKGNDA